MAEAVVPPIAGAVVNQAAIPFIKQLTYAFEASENVKALRTATDILSAKKRDVVRQVGMDVHGGREVTNEVQHWMNRVEVVREESDAIKERFNQRLCQCFSGCSLNCFSNYKISKDAYQKCSEVQVLCDEAFKALTFEPLPPASDNVKALRIATNKLSAKKEDVVGQVAREVQRGREVTKVVEQWMKRVEVIRKESDEIRERFDQRSCQCFNGCSENCFTNKISKDAYQKCLEVQVLFDEAEFEALTFEPLPPNVQRLPTTPTIPSIGNLNLELALEHINNAGVGIIGIWGMGGVGKTHLLTQINNSFDGNSIFGHVVFVTASKQCSVEKIQIAIAKRLNLELKDDDDNVSRANKIFNFLSKRGFLLLLDDLWDRVDLANVGIPFPLSSMRKVVLTTRFSTVCRQMKTKEKIKVGCLNTEDAWRLFKENVGAETFSNSSIEQKARQVSHEVRGLPLALITFGRAMHGQTDISAWDHVIELLEQSRFPQLEAEENITDESLFKILKFSYDMLRDDILQKCFLACSLWPEDYEIDKTDLIQLWLGLGIVEELGNLDIYSPGYALIRNLLDTCLLEACQREDCVKMHDVLRDMALWIARDCGKNMNKWIIKYGGGGGGSSILLPNDIWCKAEYIALWDYDEVLDIPSDVSVTNLKTLIISRCQIKSINGIHNFSCLTFLDLSNNKLINFPKIICQVVNLRYLNLSSNYIRNLPIDLKFLINLRYLILRFNKFKETPTDVFSEMKELIMLDLIQYHFNVFNNSNMLKDIESLKKIKALSITVSDNSELQHLSNLVHIPVRELVIFYDEKLNEADNSILITPSFLGKSDRQKGLLELSFKCCPGKRQLVFENSQRSINWQFQNLIHLYLLFMSDLENVVYKGVVPQNLFPKLRELEIVNCISIKNFSWIVYLQCLRRLRIERADPSVHELFTIEQASSSQSAEIEEVRNEAPINKTFPSLEKMYLNGLRNVKSICPPAITFPSLKELHVSWRSAIARLPFNRTTVPRNLERIHGSREWWASLEWKDEELKSLVEKKYMVG